MEKRLFLFVVLSIVIWGGYLALQYYVNPPKPGEVAKKPAKPVKDEVDNKQADDKPADEPKQPEKGVEKVDDKTDEPVKQAARRRVTLGSLDPNSGYRFLVTFDNLGAAIERIEFNDRFHDLDDFSAYIGHLALTNAKSGARVNVVGPGTPAALAEGSDGSTGLQVDDVITAVNKTPVKTAADLTNYLQEKTKAKDDVELSVERGSETLTFIVASIRRPLELIRPEDNSGDPALMKSARVGPPSYRVKLRQVGQSPQSDEDLAKIPSLYDVNWEVETDSQGGSVTFTQQLNEGQLEKIESDTSLVVTKTYSLAKDDGKDPTNDYHLGFRIAIENTGDKAETVAYRLEGPNGLPLEGWWYLVKVHPGWKGAGARDIASWDAYRNDHQLLGNPMIVSHAATQRKAGNPETHSLLSSGDDTRQLAYVAVDTQFFASGLLPGNVFQAQPGEKNTFKVDAAYALPLNTIEDKKWAKTTNVTFLLDSTAEEIAPGDTWTSEYVIFAGPKDPDVLPHYGLDALIEYGWFGWVSRILIKVLDALYYVIPNYGIAIILLTVVVRLCLLPFSIRQAKSAAVMQQMAPEIAKLKEKYAGDLEKQAAAQRELFAKHGFNPMGGCLLMFAQLPIFIGLYRCLATDIDLREAALIPGIQWCSNLAGPDQLFRWKEYVWPSIGDEAHGWLGPYFNVLPLITVALFLVQQKLFTPPAVDEEQKLQQKIMYFMTLFMGVMFYKVPAGLCIYFITSSLWGICERKMLKKPVPKADLPATTGKSDAGGDSKGGGSDGKRPPDSSDGGNRGGPSALERLLGMADAQLKQAKSSPSARKKAKK